MRTSPGAPLAAGTCLLGALAWAVALSSGSGPWPPLQVLVVAAGMLTLATAALAGMVVKDSRWGRRLAAGLAVGQLGLAVLVPPSPWWWAAVALAGLALVLAGGPWQAADAPARLGPPGRAVLLLCILGSLPVGLAGASVNGLGGGWVMAAVSGVTALLYAKAWPGSLFSARFLVPASSVAAAFTTPWPGWTVALAGGCLAGWAAWSKEARLAVQPLVDRTPAPAPGPTPLRIRSARDAPVGRPRPRAEEA